MSDFHAGGSDESYPEGHMLHCSLCGQRAAVRMASQLSALREAAREAWAAYYVACDARLENTGIKPAEELLGKRMRALSAAVRTIDAALASTEPSKET